MINETVLRAWGLGEVASERITVGNINETFVLSTADSRWVLQHINTDIFSVDVHHDIEAVTSHLANAGLSTPRLIHTRDHKLWAVDPDGGVWRLMTWIEGENYSRAVDSNLCVEAGRLLGQFHTALSDLRYEFRGRRLGVHDTPKHLATLRRAIATHTSHTAFSDARRLGEQIIEATTALDLDLALPPRIVHGDPKLNNIIFTPMGQARCFIDLDTVAQMSIPIELGDAFRSWCNPGGEDEQSSEFDLSYFEAGLTGYTQTAGDTLTAREWQAIVETVERITLELSARFCADALNESYFGWDESRYEAAWQHNLVRARGQWELARSIATKRAQMQACVEGLRHAKR